MQRRITFCVLVIAFFPIWGIYAQGTAFSNTDFHSGIEFSEYTFNPPTINPPIYHEDGKSLSFSWEPADPSNGYQLSYEFNIYEKGSFDRRRRNGGIAIPLYQSLIEKPILEYDPSLPSLENGIEYVVIINTLINYSDHSEKISGLENAYSFTYSRIPDCLPPTKIKISGIGTDNFHIEWDGPDAELGGINYLLRYKSLKQGSDWEEVLITVGRSISISKLDNNLEYEVEVQKICPNENLEPELTSSWTKSKPIQLASEKSLTLPAFICGDTYVNIPCNQQTATHLWSGRDTIYVRGFPVLIDSSWVGWNFEQVDVTFATGWVPLPFGDNIVKVDLSDPLNFVTVDQNGNVCSGVISGISDDPMHYPNLDPGPIPFGGQICIPPPSTPGFDSNGIHNVTGLPWDENGFGPTGTYDQWPPYPNFEDGAAVDTPSIYDPYGFDVNGNHMDGDSLNSLGCSQSQMQQNPQQAPCVAPPYEWVSSATAAGNNLVEEVKDSLGLWLNDLINELESAYSDSINTKGQECDGIRSVMTSKIGTLGYNKDYVFGKNDEYINEGMHERFTTKPEPMSKDVDRDANHKTLEEKHIELYHCDKNLHVFMELKDIFGEMKTNDMDSIKQVLLTQISQFNEDEAALYTNRDKLKEWLKSQLEEMGMFIYNSQNGIGFRDNTSAEQNGLLATRSNPDHKTESNRNNNGYGNLLAINDNELNQALYESLELTPEDISFQFRQGWKEINGIHRAYYLEAIDKARTKKQFSPVLWTDNDPTLMPIKVANRATDGRLYKVYLDDIIFTPNEATLDAYIVIEVPNTSQRIVFEAVDVHFTTKGPIVAPLKLELFSDVPIRLNNSAKLTLKGGTGNTFIAVNCQGFAGMGIEGDIELCREKALPLHETTLAILPDPERVNGSFQIFMPTWGDFYIAMDMEPFAVPAIKDYKWQIDSVIVDLSDVKSPSGVPPFGYNTALAGPSGFQNQWEGFFMENLSVTMPNQWSKSNLTIAAQNILIDNMGFSGHVSASPLLPLADGNAGGWAFSIDSFDLTIVANNIQNIGLDGLIHIPLISNANSCGSGEPTQNDCFTYDAFVEPGGTYHFDVTMPNTDFCAEMWQAGTINIYPSTSISMKYEDDDFTLKAIMDGSVVIGGDEGGGLSFDVPEIGFQGVEISNKSPYFSPGCWEFPDTLGAKIGGFGLWVNNLGMIETEEGDPALKFGAKIELSNKVDLTAEGGFRVIGELKDYNGRQKWELKRVKIDSLCINGSFPGVEEIDGCVHFYDGNSQPTYGSGFRGSASVKFKKIEGYVQAVAQFGKMTDYKYFFVDALYCGDIPLGPVQLNGLGGGVYYHMSRPASGAGLPVCTGNIEIPSGIGSSISGVTYTPTDTAGLGLKLTIAFALGNKRAFNANTTFEVQFNEPNTTGNSGISDAWIYGNGRFMANPKREDPPTYTPGGCPPVGEPFVCNVDLHMDFNNDHFHGNVEAFLDNGMMKGVGPCGRMGWAEINFQPGDWYIKMGKPYYGTGADERMGLKFTIPFFGDIAQSKAYLQIGKNLDPIPPLPDWIAELTGLEQSAGYNDLLPSRDGQTLTGNGFVFGADIQLGQRGFNFLIFEANMFAQAGFDLSLLDYGDEAICSNFGGQLGINGWYAIGQAYAGLDVGVDAKVKVFGQTKRFTIFDLAVAAALQAQLPNPIYMRGGIGADYNLLNGLVKGHCDFQFEIGEQCELQGASDPYENLPVVQATTPSEGAVEVPVSVEPVVTFNFPVESAFSMSDFGNNQVEYLVTVDEAKIMYKDWHVPAKWELISDNTELRIIPEVFLPGNDSLNLYIKVHVDSNGINIHEEIKEVTFMTAAGADAILVDNVLGSYPLDGQYNFYKEEIANHQGYILLDKGQPDLFFDNEDNYLLARFRQAGGGCTTREVEYEAMASKATFELPMDFLQPEEMYSMELVRIPISGDGYNIDPCDNLPAGSAGATNGSSKFVSYQSVSDGGTNTTPSEKVIFKAHFRVSEYNTFKEKINAWYANADKSSLFNLPSNIEPLDKFEMGKAGEALVDIRPVLETTPWFTGSNVIQYMYSNLNPCYETGAVNICLNRDVEESGFPPIKGAIMKQMGLISDPSLRNMPIEVTAADFAGNSLPSEYDDISFRLRYTLPEIINDDNTQFREDILNLMMSNISWLEGMASDEAGGPVGNLSLTELYDQYPNAFGTLADQEYFEFFFNHNSFSMPTGGTFPILFRYRLPGTEHYSSEKLIHVQW